MFQSHIASQLQRVNEKIDKLIWFAGGGGKFLEETWRRPIVDIAKEFLPATESDDNNVKKIFQLYAGMKWWGRPEFAWTMPVIFLPPWRELTEEEVKVLAMMKIISVMPFGRMLTLINRVCEARIAIAIFGGKFSVGDLNVPTITLDIRDLYYFWRTRALLRELCSEWHRKMEKIAKEAKDLGELMERVPNPSDSTINDFIQLFDGGGNIFDKMFQFLDV